MTPEPQSRSIIPRALQSRAARALRVALQRLPPRVQRLGLSVLTPVMKRWPTLLELLGLAAEFAPARSSAEHGPAGMKKGTSSDAESSTPDATFALIAALRDPRAEVAAEAAEALRHHPNESAISALRTVVENADRFFSPGVRAAAIRTLSAILPQGDGAPIRAAISDLDAEVSLAAIAGIVDRNESGSAEVLLAVLEDPRGYYVALTRGAAARGLKGLVTPPDPRRLSALMDTEADREVREILRSLVVPLAAS